MATPTDPIFEMKISQVHFYIFLVLFLLSIIHPVQIFSMELATSVTPGWHTIIYPPYFIVNTVVSILLLVVTIAYRKLAKRDKSVSIRGFLIHFTLTFPAVIYIIYPQALEEWMMMLIEQLSPERNLAVIIVLLIPYVLFVLGQLLFLGYYYSRRTILNNVK